MSSTSKTTGKTAPVQKRAPSAKSAKPPAPAPAAVPPKGPPKGPAGKPPVPVSAPAEGNGKTAAAAPPAAASGPSAPGNGPSAAGNGLPKTVTVLVAGTGSPPRIPPGAVVPKSVEVVEISEHAMSKTRTALSLALQRFETAALVTAKEDPREYLTSALLHRVKSGDVRLIACNGECLLVQTIPVDPEQAKACTWLDDGGILIPRHVLLRAQSIPADRAWLGYGKDHPWFILRDCEKEDDERFRIRERPLKCAYGLNYVKDLESAAAALASTTERLPGDAATLDRDLITLATKVAKGFGAGSIATYPGDGTKPGVITFPGVPGVMFIIPMQMAALEAGTARLVGDSALKGTIAALKAHATRHRNAARDAKNEKTKEAEKQMVQQIEQRIAALTNCTKGLPAPPPAKALPAPAPEAKKPDTVVPAAAKAAPAANVKH